MNPETYLLFYAGSAVGGAAFMFFWLKLRGYMPGPSRREKLRREMWEKEERIKQKNRCKRIEQMAHLYMNSVPRRCQTMDRQILVKYEDLLTIWDVACRIKEDI